MLLLPPLVCGFSISCTVIRSLWPLVYQQPNMHLNRCFDWICGPLCERLALLLQRGRIQCSGILLGRRQRGRGWPRCITGAFHNVIRQHHNPRLHSCFLLPHKNLSPTLFSLSQFGCGMCPTHTFSFQD